MSIKLQDAISSAKTFGDLVPIAQQLTARISFDYVHGLQGILPRTYEEPIKMFTQSKYKIYKEIPIEKLPNAFLWILTPFI